MRKQYKIRHQILKELFKSAEKEKNPQIPKERLSNIEIAKLTGIPISDIDIYHELLHEEDEIQCNSDGSGKHEMLITSKGRQSYINKKFLKEGRKDYLDSIYDPLKIILPIISIAIAAIALYLNTISANKVSNLEKQINQLKTEIKSKKK